MTIPRAIESVVSAVLSNNRRVLLLVYGSLSTTILRHIPGLSPFALLCHCMYARRKITTYKGRNRRKRCQDDRPNHVLTSPLSDIDKEETTLSEMSRRMGKRSRLLAPSDSVPDLSVIADTSKGSAPTRNPKRPRVRSDGASATSGPLLTVFNAELHANSFQTPITSALLSGKYVSSGPLNHRPASSLSPVPLAKPVFSADAKENMATSRPQTDLASPFNSHPNSRNVSPTKSQSKFKPPKRPRAKSRTLSARLSENRDFTAPATDAAPSPDRKKTKTLHHGRNPSLPSFAVDDSPDWLNYAEVKPRKPLRGSGRRNVQGLSRSTFNVATSGSQPRPLLLPIHYSSLSLEQPLAFSTPPASRRFGRSPQDSIDWSEINLTQKFSDTDVEGEDVEMADAETFTPDSASRAPRITNTRRQTVHISHDSLFSSMEISNSGSVSTVTGIPTQASSGDTGTAVNRNVGNELPNCSASNSVMSLTGVLEPTDDTNKLLNLGQAFEQTRNDVGWSGWMNGNDTASNTHTENRPKDKNTRKRTSATCLDDLEALGAKVSEMNLEGLVHLLVCYSGSKC